MKKFTALLILLIAQSALAYEDVRQGKASVYGTSKNVNCPIVVRPGIGIGPIEVNRSLQELESLMMDMRTIQGTKTHMLIGKYSIGVDEQDKVRYVEVEIGDLPDCIQYKKKKIKRSMTPVQLSKIFPKCGKESIGFGGNAIECEGIIITSGGWGGRQKTPALKIIRASDLIK